jgi:putative Ca2+/H+ antiporter (TMEM165/GDT1 family)
MDLLVGRVLTDRVNKKITYVSTGKHMRSSAVKLRRLRKPKPSGFMDWKIFLTIFASVFIAELGDKTQLATMLFAADKEVSKYTVFIAASAALVVATALGVLAGSLLSEYINEKYLHYIAGIGFITIGAYTLYSA